MRTARSLGMCPLPLFCGEFAHPVPCPPALAATDALDQAQTALVSAGPFQALAIRQRADEIFLLAALRLLECDLDLAAFAHSSKIATAVRAAVRGWSVQGETRRAPAKPRTIWTLTRSARFGVQGPAVTRGWVFLVEQRSRRCFGVAARDRAPLKLDDLVCPPDGGAMRAVVELARRGKMARLNAGVELRSTDTQCFKDLRELQPPAERSSI